MSGIGIFIGAVFSVGIAVAVVDGVYIIDEGKVGVITSWGQAERQETPQGLQFKTPFVTGVREFDVRERALSLQLTGATQNQLATTMGVTVNWRPDPAQIMEIFVKYGGPDEFATNVIRPRLNQSAKATIGQFTGIELTTQRNEVAQAIFQNAVETLSSYPALISSAQVDDFTLPERYWNAVQDREEQRERTAKEKLALEQQDLVARQAVQTANAERDAALARADGEAYRRTTLAQAEAEALFVLAQAEAEAITLKDKAEAEVIELQAQAVEDNPLLVELRRIEAWNGTLPQMVMGDSSPDLLMQIPETQ